METITFLHVAEADDIDVSLLQWVVDALCLANDEINNAETKTALGAAKYIEKAVADLNHVIIKRLKTNNVIPCAANLNKVPVR